jgi:hypothetical protein
MMEATQAGARYHRPQLGARGVVLPSQRRTADWLQAKPRPEGRFVAVRSPLLTLRDEKPRSARGCRIAE